MPFSHVTGPYNVLATLYAWLQTQLAANLPPLLTTARLVLEMPIDPLETPCYSIHLLSIDSEASPYLGSMGDGTCGEHKFGICEVNCWISRRVPYWRAQLNQMHDALMKAVLGARSQGSAIVIKDFYTNAEAPTNTTYRIVLDRIETQATLPDPNPDIERRRVLIYFSWFERT